MKMFIVDSQRIATMRELLGEASDLIKDDAYLPMFRNRQKNNPEEFQKSIEIAKTKKDPVRYFSVIWSPKKFKQTLIWIKGIINRLVSKLAELRQQQKMRKEIEQFKREYNTEGRAHLLKMHQKYKMLGLKS